MNKGSKIGLFATLTALGAGLVWAVGSSTKKEEVRTNEKEENQDKGVKKLYGDEIEDSFVSISNERIKTALTPLNERKKVQYKTDLKKYGTSQGVIDVANEELVKKKKKKRLGSMGEIGNRLTQLANPKVIQKRHKKQPTKYSAFYKWLLKEFNKTQITITNTSTEERVVTLWGMNKGGSVSPPNPSDVEDHEIITTVEVPSAIGVGIHPQGIAVNPANGLAYVANQLSNNVTVIDPLGQVVTVVELQPSLIPGFNSPVAIAVNSNNLSANYGKVYVVGSVSNTVSVIDLSHTVTNTIVVGIRPLDIAFNPINDQLYVANLFTNDVTVINANTENVSTTLAVGADPLGIGINLNNGDIYVANSSDDSVSVFDSSDNLVTTIVGVGTTPASITYHPVNNEMYVVSTGSNNVFPVNATIHTLLAPIATGNSPYKSVFNANNNYLYVGNRDDETFTVIDTDKSIRATISKGNVNIGFAISQTDNQLFVSNTTANQVNLIGYSSQSTSIIISDDYAHKSKNFMHNPGVVKHTKWVLSGDERFAVLHFVEETPTGTKISTPISHENYKSPQNYLNVSELTDLEGTVIDGKTSWVFKIAGLQTITLMVYFRQFEFWRTMSADGYKQDENPPQSIENRITQKQLI